MSIRSLAAYVGVLAFAFAATVATDALAQAPQSNQGWAVNSPAGAVKARNKAGAPVWRFTHRNGKSIDMWSCPPSPPPANRTTGSLPPLDLSTMFATRSLTGAPAFDWSYGCSATSASMMAGFYDRGAYARMYTGPTGGGVCPLNNETAWAAGESPLNASHLGIDGRAIRGHVDDYWVDVDESGNDPFNANGWTEHTSDCIGDYMGTNQDYWGNPDGGTTFFFYTDGTPLYDFADLESDNPPKRDGAHGLNLWLASIGYTTQAFGVINQYIQGYGSDPGLGFTLADYQAEIDAGRPVMIQLDGHTMLGVGYDTLSTTIYVHDTWDHVAHSMTWGSTYAGMQHQGVTVIRVTPRYMISGTVTQGGLGLSGVTVTSGSQSAITASDGTYTLRDIGAGSVTVTPSLTGFTFTPASRSYTVAADVTGADFTAGSPTRYTISGRVTKNGVGLAGITVTPTPFGSAATTNSSGLYTLRNLPAGTYTVTPSGSTYLFAPTTRSVALDADTSGEDFDAGDAYEPDNSAAAARVITSGSAAQSHNIHIAACRDWYRFSAVAGREYIFTVSAPYLDMIAYLYGTDGATQLTSDEIGNAGDPRISWVCPAAGTYYIKTEGKGTQAGAYTATLVDRDPAPIAVDDAYSTDEDTSLTVAAPGVLANDLAAGGASLTAAKFSDPAHGTLALNGDGSFTYVPAPNYYGPDSFTYNANDGTTDSNVATVTLTVDPVNDAPVGVDDAYSANGDVSLSVAAPGALGNDTDADGDPLTAVVVSGPAHGTLTLKANGSFTYKAVAAYAGPDSFTYMANDGTVDSSVVTVTITVYPFNNAPVAVAEAYSTDEDVPLTVDAPGVLGNDTDVEGDPLTTVRVTGPAHGTLTLGRDGSFTYKPAANYNGPDSFRYKAKDARAYSAAVTVTLTVRSVADAPLAAADAYLIDEDVTLIVNAPGVLGNDTDGDGDPLTTIRVTGPAHGTLTLGRDGSFTYTPAANYCGPDSFTYKAKDAAKYSPAVTVSLTVRPVNDAPAAVADAYSVNEDATLTVAAPGLLGNDTDAEGSSLTAAKLTDPAHGTLTFSTKGSFTYKPTGNYNGPDSFTYKVNDGTTDSGVGTVTLTVNPVNDAPVAVPDYYWTDQDVALIVPALGVLGNDSDLDGDPLTTVTISRPTHGALTLNRDGSYVYTPMAGFSGYDSFVYKAKDAAAYSSAVAVYITVEPEGSVHGWAGGIR